MTSDSRSSNGTSCQSQLGAYSETPVSRSTCPGTLTPTPSTRAPSTPACATTEPTAAATWLTTCSGRLSPGRMSSSARARTFSARSNSSTWTYVSAMSTPISAPPTR